MLSHIPRNSLMIFKASCCISLLSFCIFLTSLVCPNWHHPTGSCAIYAVTADYFQQTTCGQGFSQWVMLNKEKPHHWDFSRELSGRSNSDNSFGSLQAYLGEFQTIPVVARPTVFHSYRGSKLLVFEATTELGRGGWQRDRLKILRSLLFLENQPFFLNTCSSNCCSSLANFWSLKKSILTISASVLIAFLEDRNFRVPYCTILEMLLQDFFR